MFRQLRRFIKEFRTFGHQEFNQLDRQTQRLNELVAREQSRLEASQKAHQANLQTMRDAASGKAPPLPPPPPAAAPPLSSAPLSSSDKAAVSKFLAEAGPLVARLQKSGLILPEDIAELRRRMEEESAPKQ